MTNELKAAGRGIERAQRALDDAERAGDSWAATQNRKALRMARQHYARVAA